MSSILSLSKNVTGLFCRCHPGENRTLNRTVGFEKKYFSKFFWYVQSNVVSWILSLSKHVTRVFPRTHPWGNQNSQQNSCIERKVPFEIFLGMFKALQFLRFWVYRKNLQDIFLELIRGVGRTEISTELLDLKKKSPRNFLGMFEVL